MLQVGNKKILHNIKKDHTQICYKPCDIPGIYLEKTELDSNKIVISRTTFSRLIKSSHKK